MSAGEKYRIVYNLNDIVDAKLLILTIVFWQLYTILHRGGRNEKRQEGCALVVVVNHLVNHGGRHSDKSNPDSCMKAKIEIIKAIKAIMVVNIQRNHSAF